MDQPAPGTDSGPCPSHPDASDRGQVRPGAPAPLGATVQPGGTNFSVYSRHALSVELLLYGGPDSPRADRIVPLTADVHRTGPYWHVFVPGAGHGQVYAWRVCGPHQPARGHLFDGDKVLLDPYGRAVCGMDHYDRRAARAQGDNEARSLRSVVVDPGLYDWEGDRPLARGQGREVIYEMHAAGFTASPTSGLDDSVRGTYAGLIERIPYLQELGVTAVELLPVHQFDPRDAPRGRTNYWGYSSLGFFAPHAGFSSDRSPTGPVDEFRDMVKALHRAGLRVILDVVYNHTAEGGPDGPTLSWRGLDNSTYYLLREGRRLYADYTGCGNTVNTNHPVTRRLILDSLRYWVEQMHVDGFRFDLGSVMARDEDGRVLQRPPVIWAIDTAPELAGTALIAEAWDAGGLYQVGSFPGDRFAQWNGPFRDDVRRFVRGDRGMIESLMARLVGSPDLFHRPEHRPGHCINFVTCHDGFSLADLVAYTRKRNLANGEENRDGSDNNLSSNHGVEGPTDDPQIQALRLRQVKNFHCLLHLAHGTPMLWMGDEVGHSRQGNNNPWCQDNELNWFDWDLPERNAELLRFVRHLLALTRSLPILQTDRFWTATSPEKRGEITWHGTEPGRPDWSESSRCLAYTLGPTGGGRAIHVMLNADDRPHAFTPPPPSAGQIWHLALHTGLASPQDIAAPGESTPWDRPDCRLPAHSVAVLAEHPARG